MLQLQLTSQLINGFSLPVLISEARSSISFIFVYLGTNVQLQCKLRFNTMEFRPKEYVAGSVELRFLMWKVREPYSSTEYQHHKHQPIDIDSLELICSS